MSFVSLTSVYKILVLYLTKLECWKSSCINPTSNERRRLKKCPVNTDESFHYHSIRAMKKNWKKLFWTTVPWRVGLEKMSLEKKIDTSYIENKEVLNVCLGDTHILQLSN